MSNYLALIFTFSSFIGFAQDDSLIRTKPFSLPKNQISLHMNPFSIYMNGPYYGLEYRRLRRKYFGLLDPETRETFVQYLAISTEFSGFQKPTVIYEDQFLKTISDTTATMRVSGSGSADYNLKIGLENQQRLFSLSNHSGGLQLVVGYYGILGITQKAEEYVETAQKILTSQQTSLESNVYTGEFPITGQRLSNYLRIGGGLYLGFDYLMELNSSRTFLWGMNFGMINLSAAFLTKSTTVMDPDLVYTERQDFYYADYNMNFHLRFGITF